MRQPLVEFHLAAGGRLSFSFLYPFPGGVQRRMGRMCPTGFANRFDQLSLDINTFQNAPGLFHRAMLRVANDLVACTEQIWHPIEVGVGQCPDDVLFLLR